MSNNFFKTFCYFQILVSFVGIFFLCFHLEEKRWEFRAIKAGVGEYNEFQQFRFKTKKDIVTEFAIEEQMKNLQTEKFVQPPESMLGKLGVRRLDF